MFGGQILPALQGQAADLIAAGIPTTLNRAQAKVPGAVLVPTQAYVSTLEFGGTLRADLYLIGSDAADDTTVLKQLSGLLDIAMSVITLNADEVVDLNYAFQTPGGTVPAFRVPIDLDL